MHVQMNDGSVIEGLIVGLQTILDILEDVSEIACKASLGEVDGFLSGVLVRGEVGFLIGVQAVSELVGTEVGVMLDLTKIGGPVLPCGMCRTESRTEMFGSKDSGLLQRQDGLGDVLCVHVMEREFFFLFGRVVVGGNEKDNRITKILFMHGRAYGPSPKS